MDEAIFSLKACPEKGWGAKKMSMALVERAYGGADAQNVACLGAITMKTPKLAFAT